MKLTKEIILAVRQSPDLEIMRAVRGHTAHIWVGNRTLCRRRELTKGYTSYHQVAVGQDTVCAVCVEELYEVGLGIDPQVTNGN